MKNIIILLIGVVIVLGAAMYATSMLRGITNESNGAAKDATSIVPVDIEKQGQIAQEKARAQAIGDLEVAPIEAVSDIVFAPDFSLPRIDGSDGSITLSEYRGVKPVIIDFFAPHCPYCRQSIKKHVPLYNLYKDQVEVILVTGIDPEPQNSNYFAKNPVPMPVVYDGSQKSVRDYQVRFTNTQFLISKDGSVLESDHGGIREDHFKRLIADAQDK